MTVLSRLLSLEGLLVLSWAGKGGNWVVWGFCWGGEEEEERGGSITSVLEDLNDSLRYWVDMLAVWRVDWGEDMITVVFALFNSLCRFSSFIWLLVSFVVTLRLPRLILVISVLLSWIFVEIGGSFWIFRSICPFLDRRVVFLFSIMGRDGCWGRDEALVERRVGWMGMSWSDSSEEGAKKEWEKMN